MPETPLTTTSASDVEVMPPLNIKTTAPPASVPVTMSSAAPAGLLPEPEVVDGKVPLNRLELRDEEGGHVAFVDIPVRDSEARVIRWQGRLFMMQFRTNQYREVAMAEAQDAED